MLYNSRFTPSPTKRSIKPSSQSRLYSSDIRIIKPAFAPIRPIISNYIPFENKYYSISPEKRISSAPYLKSSLTSFPSNHSELNGGKEDQLVTIINKDTKYHGQTKQTMKKGIGNLYDLKNNLIYEGQWENDKYQGKGTLYNIQQYKSWTKYVGEFKNGLKEGGGVEYYKDGSYYVGNFNYNLKSGVGSYYKQDKLITGIWKKGVLIEEF